MLPWLIVPSGNLVCEDQVRRMVPATVGLHVTRLPLTGTSEAALKAMTDRLDEAARLLADARVDLIAFNCTAVSTMRPGSDTRAPCANQQPGSVLVLGALGGGRRPGRRLRPPSLGRLLSRADLDALKRRGWGVGQGSFALTPERSVRDSGALRGRAGRRRQHRAQRRSERLGDPRRRLCRASRCALIRSRRWRR
jgi:hypothetical protein